MLLGSTSSKAASKKLVKLTPAVIFINVLQAAFVHADPKSAKNDSQVISLFALSGSERIKVLCKMFMKLTPELPHSVSRHLHCTAL